MVDLEGKIAIVTGRIRTGDIYPALKPGSPLYLVGWILDDSRASPLSYVTYNLLFVNDYADALIRTVDDLDAAISWHPGSSAAVMSRSSLANFQVYWRFVGRASHAAGAPHLGRSALDAVELMNIGVNFMREHMPANARVHYSITDAGGMSPNDVAIGRYQLLTQLNANPNNEPLKNAAVTLSRTDLITFR